MGASPGGSGAQHAQN